MPFTKKTKDAARFRQWGKCASCGDDLDENDHDEHAHHIYPQQYDGPDDVDNCVILCYNCHGHVHNDFHFRSGIVAQFEYFKYFYG